MSDEGFVPAWHYASDVVRIRKICVGSWENNVYVVACAATDTAVIIDAAAEPEAVIAATADVNPIAILTTHGHFDHVGAARPVADRLGIPFRLHRADTDTFDLTPDGELTSGPIEVGSITIDAIETPGHTPGSVCFALEGVLFSGDTLFPGGPGATRGPDSDFAQIMGSIDALFTLPPDTLVMPGHGLDTTIGYEKPHAAEWRDRGW